MPSSGLFALTWTVYPTGPPLTSADPYTNWDFAWTYRITKQLSYIGVIENMLDRSYMEALGFPALRMTYRTGLRFRF